MKAKLIFNINILDDRHCSFDCKHMEGDFCSFPGYAVELLHKDESGQYLRGSLCLSGKTEVKR